MSWKGFQKAVTRLPHMVMQKAGATDETVDIEYKQHATTFATLQSAVDKLERECRHYRDAIFNLLTHQTNLYQQLWQVLDDDQHPEHRRVLDMAIAETKELKVDLISQLDDCINEKVLKTVIELQKIFEAVAAKITKRTHKLVDYDRHRISLKKLADNKERNLGQERKLIKLEEAVDLAYDEYEKYNEQLKRDLPQLFKLCGRILHPCFESIVQFQKVFFVLLSEATQRSTTLRPEMDVTIIIKLHQNQFEAARNLLDENPLFSHPKKREGSIKSVSDTVTSLVSPATSEVPRSSINLSISSPRMEAKPERKSPSKQVETRTINEALHETTKIVSMAIDANVVSRQLEKRASDPVLQKPKSIADIKTEEGSTEGSIEDVIKKSKDKSTREGGKVAALAAKLQNANIVFGAPFMPTSRSAPKKTQYEKEEEQESGISRDYRQLLGGREEAKLTMMQDPTEVVRKAKHQPSRPIPPRKHYVIAVYDYEGRKDDGDISFCAGDRIELIKKTDKQNDWWTGRIRGETGLFPGNYVREG